MQTVYVKVLCIWLFLDDLMSNDITPVLLLEFHSVPFIVSLDTPAVTLDAGFLCDTTALVGYRIKETSCSVLQERTASPAPLRSSLFCKPLCAVCRSCASTVPLNLQSHDCWTCSCTIVFLYCRRYTMIMAGRPPAYLRITNDESARSLCSPSCHEAGLNVCYHCHSLCVCLSVCPCWIICSEVYFVANMARIEFIILPWSCSCFVAICNVI